MTDIEQLLQKYSKPYVPGEKRSTEYDQEIRKSSLLKYRLQLLDILDQQLPDQMKLKNYEKELITSILTTFNNDLKTLHRQASTEAIILSIIYTIKKRTIPTLNIEHKDYKAIFTKYGVTYPVLTTILSRLCNYYIITSPIIIHETTRYDQQILYKQNNNNRLSHQ